MVLPDKITQPADSLMLIGSRVVKICHGEVRSIEDIYFKLLEDYPVHVSFEKFIYTLDFLYISGLLRYDNETIVLRK